MTPESLEHFRHLLQVLHKQLSGKGPMQIEPNRRSDEEVGTDEDDQALNEMLQSIASNRNKNSAVLLVKVGKALKKLKDSPDDFGLCEDCDEELPEGRLNAMPYAELCVDCQAKRDKPKGQATRRSAWEFKD